MNNTLYIQYNQSLYFLKQMKKIGFNICSEFFLHVNYICFFFCKLTGVLKRKKKKGRLKFVFTKIEQFFQPKNYNLNKLI